MVNRADDEVERFCLSQLSLSKIQQAAKVRAERLVHLSKSLTATADRLQRETHDLFARHLGRARQKKKV
jgi:hypothetical protein